MQISKLLKFCPKTLALLLGGISVAALPPYYILPVVFLCFGGLLLLLCFNPAPQTAFAIGYWFGFGHFGIGFSWAANALLVDSQTYGWLYPVCILSAGAFFGLFTALPALLTAWFRTPISKLFALAGLWTASEWLRSFVLTGFPWNLLGSYFPPRIFPNRFDLGDLRPDACFAALEHGSGFIFLSRLKILPPGCRRPPDCSSGFCGRFRIRPY